MTEHDPLRGRFDVFREQTTGAVPLPSVEEIPRRLRRSRRRRVAAVALAVVALIALVTLPSWGRDAAPPTPATSPTPGPSATGSSAVAAPPPGAGSSGTASAGSRGPTSGGPCGTSARGLPTLPSGRREEIFPNYSSDGTMMVPYPANAFDLCPAARVPFVHVSFAWDVDRQQYVLEYTAAYVLTKAQPSVPKPGYHTQENNICGEVDTLLATGRPVPQTIPRSVQDSADPNDATLAYLQKTALALPKSISVYSFAKVTSISHCVPKTASPSPQG